MFRPIPMKAWGPSLGGTRANLGQGDDTLLSTIEDLEARTHEFSPEVFNDVMARSKQCRDLVSSIPSLHDAGWTPAWAKASNCIGDLRTYIDELTANIETGPTYTEPVSDDSERIIGLDPMVFWSGAGIAGVLLIAGVMGAFK